MYNICHFDYPTLRVLTIFPCRITCTLPKYNLLKYCFFLQEHLLSSSDGSDVIIIENFPSTINEKVC